MATHLWHLAVTDDARRDLNAVPSSELMSVFRSMRQLLLAENPQSVQGVKKLVEKRFEGQWRHRSGAWRIFFTITAVEVTHMKHTYKGTVTIRSVVRRDEAY